ncbi:MAG: hypothetical protein HC859_06125 [Bacteroidia bacterium]|nr:hypothetical protein [Bacteroidia bacterium]
MKSTLSIITFMLLSLLVQAQTAEVPKKEFAVALSASSLTVSPGDNKTVEMSILRSKSYQKGEATLNISSRLPEGLAVTFEPAKTSDSKTEVRIAAAAGLASGTYNVILNCTLNYKAKGTSLKIVVP